MGDRFRAARAQSQINRSGRYRPPSPPPRRPNPGHSLAFVRCPIPAAHSCEQIARFRETNRRLEEAATGDVAVRPVSGSAGYNAIIRLGFPLLRGPIVPQVASAGSAKRWLLPLGTDVIGGASLQRRKTDQKRQSIGDFKQAPGSPLRHPVLDQPISRWRWRALCFRPEHW